MKPFKFYLLHFFLILSTIATAQEGLYIFGTMDNAPGYDVPIDITVFSDDNSPVSVTAVAYGGTNIVANGGAFIEIPNWTYLTTSFTDCNDSLVTSYFYNDTVLVLVDIFISLNYCESSAIFGCTDPVAYNYNPNATEDDGSCIYSQPGCVEVNLLEFCVDTTSAEYDSTIVQDPFCCETSWDNICQNLYLSLGGEPLETCAETDSCTANEAILIVNIGTWGQEISWSLLHDGVVILSNGNYNDVDDMDYAYDLCLEDGCYIFEMFDAFGDGWNGGGFQVVVDNEVIASGGITSGEYGMVEFGINEAGCEQQVIPGCTDPTALNYNPNASIDDGSCEYETVSNDLCADAAPLLEGTQLISNTGAVNNEGIWGECWAFGSGEGEQTSVWFSFTTPDTPASIHIEASADGTGTLTDTQFGLFESCGGEMIYCDGNAGDGLFSAFNFACGELEVNTEYILMIDGYFGDNGTCYLTYEIDTLCAEIPGCTDPIAYNYNPSATVDDGSCEYITSCESNIVMVHISTQNWGNEISWNLLQNDSVIASGGDYSSNSSFNDMWLCLEDGCYSIEMFDSFGDGWNGATITIMDPDQNIYTSGTLSTGSYGTEVFGINAVCDSTGVVFGCTNPDAINYNPNATEDDGSCEYEFECSINFTVSPDTTGAQVMWITPSENIFNAAWVEWDFGDGTTSTDLFPVHTYPGDGPYTLCLTAYFEEPDGGFCEITYCAVLTDEMINPPGMQSSGFTINVLDPFGETSAIAETDADSNISVWPNPAFTHAQLEFSLTVSASFQMEIIDVTGKTVKSELVSGAAGSNLHQLDVSMLKPGMYFVNLTGNNMRMTTRLVKQ